MLRTLLVLAVDPFTNFLHYSLLLPLSSRCAGQDPYWTGPEAYQDKTLAKYSYFGSSVAISKEVFAVGAPFDFDEDQTVRGGSVSLFDVYYTSDSSLEKVVPLFIMRCTYLSLWR